MGSETRHDPQGFEDAEAAERRRMAAQDEDALQADVDLDADEYWMAETDEFLLTRDEAEARRWLAIGHDVRRVRVHITDSATPPTPDRAAVREALVLMLSATPYRLLDPLADALGHKGTFPERVADALLRPAPLPADVQAVVDELRGFLSTRTQLQDGETIGHSFTEHCQYDLTHGMLRTLLAHLTREAR